MDEQKINLFLDKVGYKIENKHIINKKTNYSLKEISYTKIGVINYADDIGYVSTDFKTTVRVGKPYASHYIRFFQMRELMPGNIQYAIYLIDNEGSLVINVQNKDEQKKSITLKMEIGNRQNLLHIGFTPRGIYLAHKNLQGCNIKHFEYSGLANNELILSCIQQVIDDTVKDIESVSFQKDFKNSIEVIYYFLEKNIDNILTEFKNNADKYIEILQAWREKIKNQYEENLVNIDASIDDFKYLRKKKS